MKTRSPKTIALSISLGLILFITPFLVNVHAATEIAKVNGSVISLEDFNRKYKENLKFFQFKAPTKAGVLDEMIKRELGVQEAKRLGLDKDPEIIDRVNTVLYHALIDKKLSKEFEAIKITDDDAKKFYEGNPEIRTSHIFVALKPDASADAEKKAREKIQKIRDQYLKDGKMSFSEVAQRFSEGAAAPMGGDIDYQTRDKLDPAYYAASIKLKTPGKVSDIIRSQFGLHIIKLSAIKNWEATDRAHVKRMLFDEKKNELYEKYMAQLKQQAKVSVHSDLLKE